MQVEPNYMIRFLDEKEEIIKGNVEDDMGRSESSGENEVDDEEKKKVPC
jgi:hypothetical protein